MVLQTSGPISMSDLRGEFGGSVPDSLSEYYRGEGLVPDTPANSGIPTIGNPISLTDFYGGDASVGAPTLTNQSSTHDDTGSVDAGFAFDTDGTLYDIGPSTIDRTLLDSGEWWSERPDTGIGSSYDVRCESITGLGQSWSAQAAAVGTWVTISTEQVWRVTVISKNSPDTKACTAVFEIRETGGDGTVLATATLSAHAKN